MTESKSISSKTAATQECAECDPFPNQIVIKLEPELRHALAHIWYAIDALAHGCPLVAIQEIKCIEALIFFDGDDQDIESWLKKNAGGYNRGRKEEELQGQEKL